VKERLRIKGEENAELVEIVEERERELNEIKNDQVSLMH